LFQFLWILVHRFLRWELKILF